MFTFDKNTLAIRINSFSIVTSLGVLSAIITIYVYLKSCCSKSSTQNPDEHTETENQTTETHQESINININANPPSSNSHYRSKSRLCESRDPAIDSATLTELYSEVKEALGHCIPPHMYPQESLTEAEAYFLPSSQSELPPTRPLHRGQMEQRKA